MKDTNKPDLPPYSSRCLRAIEGLVGSRALLADALGVSKFTIDSWFSKRRIPRKAVLELVSISEHKFSAEELLGKYDDQ